MGTRIERLERLAELRKIGALTDAEFQAQKTQLFGSPPTQKSTPIKAPSAALADSNPQEESSVQLEGNSTADSPHSGTANNTIRHGFSQNNTSSYLKRSMFICTFIRFLEKASFGNQILLLLALVILSYFVLNILKFIGVISGVVLLLYFMKKISGLKSMGMISEIEDGARNRLNALAFGAVALIVVSASIDYAEFQSPTNRQASPTPVSSAPLATADANSGAVPTVPAMTCRSAMDIAVVATCKLRFEEMASEDPRRAYTTSPGLIAGLNTSLAQARNAVGCRDLVNMATAMGRRAVLQSLDGFTRKELSLDAAVDICSQVGDGDVQKYCDQSLSCQK